MRSHDKPPLTKLHILIIDIGIFGLLAAIVMLIALIANLNATTTLSFLFCFALIPISIIHNYLIKIEKKQRNITPQDQRHYLVTQGLRLLLFFVIFWVTILLVLLSVHLLFFWWGLLCALLIITVGFFSAVFVDISLRDRRAVAATIPTTATGQPIIRGPALISQAEAQEKALQHGNSNAEQPRFYFGGLEIPNDQAYEHTYTIGTTGSGKTKSLKAMAATTLPLIGKGYGHRAVINDPKGKGEILPYLKSSPLISCEVHNLNPFLNPACSVDILKTITDPAVAISVGRLLVPIDKETKQPYFARTGGALLGGILWAIKILIGDRANLRHALLIMRYRHRIEQVLKQVPDVRHILDQHMNQESANVTVQSVISETAGKTGMLEPVAAALQRVKKNIDLRAWVETKESILVLGTSPERSEVMAAYNRVIVTLLGNILLSREDRTFQDNPHEKHWFFLDEVHELGCIEIFPSMLSQGRAKGICGNITFHTKGEIDEVYGRERADQILSSINSRLFLLVGDPATEKYIEQEMGQHEVKETHKSRQYNPKESNWSWSESEQLTTKPLVLGSEMSDLPRPSRETGISGFAKILGVGRYKVHIPGDIIEALDPPGTPSVSRWYRDREPQELILKTLTEEEKQWFGIDDSVLEPESEKAKPKQEKSNEIEINETPAFSERERADIKEILKERFSSSGEEDPDDGPPPVGTKRSPKPRKWL